MRSHKHTLRTGPPKSDLPKQEHGAASITRRRAFLRPYRADSRTGWFATLRSGGGRALLPSLRSDCNECLRRPPLLSFAPACWHHLLRSGSPGRAVGRFGTAMCGGWSVGSRPGVHFTERHPDQERQPFRRGRVARLRASPALAPWRQVRYAPCHHLSPTRFESAGARIQTRSGPSEEALPRSTTNEFAFSFSAERMSGRAAQSTTPGSPPVRTGQGRSRKSRNRPASPSPAISCERPGQVLPSGLSGIISLRSLCADSVSAEGTSNRNPNQNRKMIREQLAHVMRQLMKTSDLSPEDADVIWQWLEGIHAVPFWAGLEPTLYERTKCNEGKPLVEQVSIFMEGKEMFTLNERIGKFAGLRSRNRMRSLGGQIAVGEGDMAQTHPAEE